MNSLLFQTGRTRWPIATRYLLSPSQGRSYIPDVPKYTTHIQTNIFQKGLLALGSSIIAILDPTRQDMVATLGETTSSHFITKLRDEMLLNAQGRSILKQRPFVNSNTINMSQLEALPNETFGKQYVQFLKNNHISPDTRCDVKFIDDEELAYVMLRYRQIHDFCHTITGLPISVTGELGLKWFEMLQTGLPMTALSSLFGPLRLNANDRQILFQEYIPWAIEYAHRAPLLLTVKFEDHFDVPIEDLRQQLGISPAPQIKPQ